MGDQGIEAEMEGMVSREATEIAAASTVLPFVDLGMDLVGKFGEGGASIDDYWDEKTRFSSEFTQNFRDVAGVIVPTIAGSMTLAPLAGMAAKGAGGGAIAQGLAKVGATAAVDVSVVATSDYSERDEGMMNALDGLLDRMGNPLGMNIPDAMQVLDDNDPGVRRLKLMAEAGVFSIVADGLGYLLNKGLKWFKPGDDVSAAYKAEVEIENVDPASVSAASSLDDQIEETTQILDVISKKSEVSKETVKRIQELFTTYDRNLSTALDDFTQNFGGKNLSDSEITSAFLADHVLTMQSQKAKILGDVRNFGFSDATTDPLEAYVARQNASRDWQTADSGAKKVASDPFNETFHPDIQPDLADASSTAARFSIPPANVARNSADIAAEKVKISE